MARVGQQVDPPALPSFSPFPDTDTVSPGPVPAACRAQRPPGPRACGDTARGRKRPRGRLGPAAGKGGAPRLLLPECPPSRTVLGDTAGLLWGLEDGEGETGRNRDRCPTAAR